MATEIDVTKPLALCSIPSFSCKGVKKVKESESNQEFMTPEKTLARLRHLFKFAKQKCCSDADSTLEASKLARLTRLTYLFEGYLQLCSAMYIVTPSKAVYNLS